MNSIIIILASSFKPNGDLSDNTIARLNKAISILTSMTTIILSGGEVNIHGEIEADKMKEYLIKCNVNNKMFLEKTSRDTYENLRNVYRLYGRIIRESNVTIISSDFHMLRVFLLSKKIGYRKVSYVSTRAIGDNVLHNYFRECGAIVREIYLRRLF